MTDADQTFLYEHVTPRTDTLTEGEREVWRNVENGPWGVREYARHTDRSPGTVGNLLNRCRDKLGESE